VVEGDTFLDSSFSVAGDWKLWIDIWRQSSITHVDDLLTLKRYHDRKETSKNYDKAVIESEQMIQEILSEVKLDDIEIMREFYRKKTKTLLRYNFWYLATIMFSKYIMVELKKYFQ
jgi:hypothetical protein